MVKASLRCASPEQLESFAGRRRPVEAPEAPPAKRPKEFAWMDSDDEVSESPAAEADQAPAEAPERSPSGSEPEVPESAQEVQSLAQMMRLMECPLQRPLSELRVEVLAAKAREDPAAAHGGTGTGTEDLEVFCAVLSAEDLKHWFFIPKASFS